MLNITLVPAAVALASLNVPSYQERSTSSDLEVLRGRVVLHVPGQGERLARANEKLDWPAGAELEVGAGAEVRLSWSGQASWHLWGPAVLDWNEGQGSGTDSGGLVFEIEELAWADIEIRRGVHRLDLPSHWSARLESGAIHLRSLPSGPLEVRHHAGTPLELLWSGDPAHVRPPITVYPGSSLRLERPPEGPADRTGRAQAWEDPSWPWSRRSDDEGQARERGQLAQQNERQQQGPQPWPSQPGTRSPSQARVGEFQAPESTRVEVRERGSPSTAPVPSTPRDSTTTSRAPQATEGLSEAYRSGAPSASNPSTTSPSGKPSSGTSSASEPSSVELRKRDLEQGTDAWRGVKFADRTRAGSVWVERRPGVEVRALEGGRWKVLVDYSVPRNVWCFSPEHDFLLAPGAVVVFEADGSLRTSFGDIETQPALPGRTGGGR